LSRPGVGQAIYTALAELGADPDDLLAELGLDPRHFDGGKLVPYAVLSRLIALGVERTNCPHLGLYIGQRATLTSLGWLGLLMRHSDTVVDALRALEAHSGTQNWGAVVGLGIGSDITVLSYAPYGPEAESAAIHSERALATLTNVLRALCGSDWAPDEVLLPRYRPRDTIVYDRFFRAPVRFDQEAAALVFRADLLEQRIAGADLTVRQSAEDHVRQLEAKQSCNFTDELRRYLRTQVTRQRCHAERVARMKLVTRRTMSRRLKAQGTTLTRLADEAQFQVARQLLADTRMSVTQISTALNFSEPAAFTHAFRRWAGMTPSAWRRENQPVEAARLLSPQNPPEQPSPSFRASKPCRAAKQANLPPERVSMRTARVTGAAVLGLGLAILVRAPDAWAVQASLSDYQGAWVLEGRDCTDVYASGGKATAFKKPIDIFAPAFIVSGRRLRTPMASCQIKSVRPTGDRQLLLLDCTNAVAGNEVRVLMAPASGSLKRYYNEQDTTGVGYQRCSR
jgi:AraC-like DNA-binding protein